MAVRAAPFHLAIADDVALLETLDVVRCARSVQPASSTRGAPVAVTDLAVGAAIRSN